MKTLRRRVQVAINVLVLVFNYFGHLLTSPFNDLNAHCLVGVTVGRTGVRCFDLRLIYMSTFVMLYFPLEAGLKMNDLSNVFSNNHKR